MPKPSKPKVMNVSIVIDEADDDVCVPEYFDKWDEVDMSLKWLSQYRKADGTGR